MLRHSVLIIQNLINFGQGQSNCVQIEKKFEEVMKASLLKRVHCM